MEHSELFLLLPRYEDVVEQPEYIKSHNTLAESEILKVVESIREICCFIETENYFGYYDANNISAFLYPVETIEECYPNVRTRMRVVMNKWGENWRTQKVQSDTGSYMYNARSIEDDTLCEMAERKFLSNDSDTFLLVNHDALFYCGRTIKSVKTVRNQDEIELDIMPLDVKSILEWFETNRKPRRIFNLNPKHGESGTGAHPDNKGEKVSLLMCGRDDAQAMLSKAIGLKFKTLYYFDSIRGQYIEFRHENNNTYHGFHLDEEDQNRVPDSIKSIISRLLSPNPTAPQQ